MSIAKKPLNYCLNECFEPLTSKNVRVKEEAKNGAFGLASVWAYQKCRLNDYHKKKNSADVEEQIETECFRLNLSITHMLQLTEKSLKFIRI